jgi:FkbM family methyltransferase
MTAAEPRPAGVPGDLATPEGVWRALAALGREPALREAVLAVLREVEARWPDRGRRVREEITGPIADALLADAGIVRRVLADGTILEFRYASRIARDFVMAGPEPPDHVWEPQTTRLLLRLAAGGGDAIVGGAYFGDHAILLSRALAAGGGICHAFEPNPAQAEMLERNAALNGLANLRLSRRALWRTHGERLHLDAGDALARVETAPTAAHGGTEVETTTVDHYLASAADRRIGLMMLDVEGAEYAALQGAERLLGLPPAAAPHVIFEVHRQYVDWSRGLEETDIARFMRERGFTLYAIRDFHSNRATAGSPIELVPIADVYLEGPPHGFNVLATKRPEAVVGDGFRLCRGVSPKLLVHGDPARHHPLDGL